MSEESSELMNITQVGKKFKVATSLIRYWESEFDILNPGRDEKGNRIYNQEDIKNLELVYHLVKEKGFTLDGAKSELEDNGDDTRQKVELINSLNEVKSFLSGLK